MATATKTVLWWRYVTFGPCELSDVCITPTQDRGALEAAYAEEMRELSCQGRQAWTGQHSWLHGYDSREAAERGDCSVAIGTHHRVA